MAEGGGMSDRLNALLDELTALTMTWERRALADSLPKCSPSSTLYIEQKAWARARQNDALELARLVAEFRQSSAKSLNYPEFPDSSTKAHKAWKGW
jgi:hypothetical protein